MGAYTVGRRTTSLFLAALWCLGASAVDAAEPKKAPVTVYVQDFKVEPKLRQDGGALAASFCAELAKDPGVDVVCSGDIRQLLDFGAFQAMAGNSDTNTSPAVKKRLGGVTVVVNGSLVEGKHGLISTLTVSDRDVRFEDELVQAGGERGVIKVKGISGGVNGVIRQYPAWAKRAAVLIKGPKSKAKLDEGPEATGVETEARGVDP